MVFNNLNLMCRMAYHWAIKSHTHSHSTCTLHEDQHISQSLGFLGHRTNICLFCSLSLVAGHQLPIFWQVCGFAVFNSIRAERILASIHCYRPLSTAIFIFSHSNQWSQTEAGRRNSPVPFCTMNISIHYCYWIQGIWPRWWQNSS